MNNDIKGFLKDAGSMTDLAYSALQHHNARMDEAEWGSRDYYWHKYQSYQARAVMYEFMAKGREAAIKNVYNEFTAQHAAQRKVARAEAELHRLASAEHWETAQAARVKWREL